MVMIYYFTRNGDSRAIAADLSALLGGQVYQITDGRDWSGPAGFIRGGYYASAKKSLPADFQRPQDDAVIYLCFPVWAGGFPPAVRTFIDQVGRQRIIAVPTSLGGELNDAAGFPQVIPVYGKDKTVRL